MILRAIDRGAPWLVVALPLIVIGSRSAAEIAIALLAGLLLCRVVCARDAQPLAAPWFLLSCAYWIWVVAVTASTNADIWYLGQALVWIRFPLAVAACAVWLAEARMRVVALWTSTAAALFTIIELWAQFLLGRGLTGTGRALSGYLSGPFARPRAGMFLISSVWPACAVLAARYRQGWKNGLALAALAAFLLGTLFLTGQRMPFLLALGSIVFLAFAVPAWRGALLPFLIGLGGVLLVLMSFAAETAARFLEHFPHILAHFPDSHYGQILARAWAIHADSPWIGHGAEAFRRLCPDAQYHIGWGGTGDGGGAGICVPHAHNIFLDALLDGGVMGLVLFAGAHLLLLLAAWHATRRAREPARYGALFALFLLVFPFATSNAYSSIPTAALRCFMAGWALARASGPRPLHTAARF